MRLGIDINYATVLQTEYVKVTLLNTTLQSVFQVSQNISPIILRRMLLENIYLAFRAIHVVCLVYVVSFLLKNIFSYNIS